MCVYVFDRQGIKIIAFDPFNIFRSGISDFFLIEITIFKIWSFKWSIPKFFKFWVKSGLLVLHNNVHYLFIYFEEGEEVNLIQK